MADSACRQDEAGAENGHAELLAHDGEDSDSARPSIRREAPNGALGRFAAWVHEDPMLALTLLGVAVGICFGFVLAAVLPGSGDTTGFRDTVVKLVSLPGRMFLNLLKMMVLPLISGSMIAGVCALKSAGANTGKLARVAFSYFAVTTLLAVVIGLLVVNVVQPGRATNMDTEEVEKSDASMLDTMLGVLLKVCPPNIVEAAATMNVLGVLTFSLFFGVVLARLPGETGQPLIQGVQIFNQVVMGMVMAILWLSPVGIACLIAGNMAQSPDLAQTAQQLLLYSFSVVFGIALQAFLVLPAIYWTCTRKNPLVFMRGMTQALMTAFGTDSSAATLPVTILCCQKLKVSNEVCQFVLPLGATVNMNGTALYEALTVIFIAQMHDEPLTISHMLVIACTSTLAAVGAAAIPSAGLVTMVMVLQAAGLDQYVADLSIIFTIDWALDRVRTVCNVLSDSFGAAIVQHLCFDTNGSYERTKTGSSSSSPGQGPLSGGEGGRDDGGRIKVDGTENRESDKTSRIESQGSDEAAASGGSKSVFGLQRPAAHQQADAEAADDPGPFAL